MSDACRDFDSLLLDLAYGELDDGTRARLEAHAASCAACAASLEAVTLTRRMCAQIETPAPPDTFDAAILEAASRAAAMAADPSRVEPQRAVARAIEAGPSLGERLRAFLLRPALVTACVAAVVLGVSLFVMRGVQAPGESRGRGEPGAPFLGPAMPMGATPGPQAVVAEAPTAREEAETAITAPEAAQAAGPASEGKAERAPAPAESIASNLGTGSAPGDGQGLGRGGGGYGAKDKKADLAADEDRLAAPAQAKGALGGAAEAEAPMKAAARAAPALDDVSGAVGLGEESFEEGMAAYARGDCATATDLLRRVLGPASGAPDRVPSALHHLGRCEKRQGRCAQALPYYDELLGRYLSYPARTDALVEASACERRLGHLDRAQARLNELSSEPGGAAKAKKAAQQ
jgi:TolA-binding protein